MSEGTELVQDESVQGTEISPEQVEAKQSEGPKEGDAVLFSSEASKPNIKVKWAVAQNTIFKRPNGDSGPVQWLCVDEVALEAAGGDFYKVKYAGVAIFKAPRVLEIPDLTEEEKAAAEASKAQA